MDVQAALAQITAAGTVLGVRGDRLVVRSRQRLTDEQREFIRAHKPDFIAALASPPDLTDADHEAIHETIEERAAVREYDGGQSREEAERQAKAEVRVYRSLIAMPDGSPAKWVTSILPGYDLGQAKEMVAWRFGAERVLEVLPYQAKPMRAAS